MPRPFARLRNPIPAPAGESAPPPMMAPPLGGMAEGGPERAGDQAEVTFFARSTIKRKLMLIIMITCSVALLLACGAILAFELAQYKTVLRRNTEVIAQLVAGNAELALKNQDKQSARKSLAALEAEPTVLSACLYTAEGQLFASYFKEGSRLRVPPPPQPDGYTFHQNTLSLFRSVRAEGRRLGAVHVEASLELIRERLRTYLSILGAAMLSATLVAFLLSLRLQRLISSPVARLAALADRVARERNFSIRATPDDGAEMGLLIDRFNEMLAGIEDRDAALGRARNELEKRVDERTKELQLEVKQRSKAEAELRISQQKFETLVHSIEGVVWEADPESFAFQFVSRQAERLLGFPPGDWTANPTFWASRLFEEDRVKATNLRRKSLLQEKPSQLEYRLVRADGGVVWIREISTLCFENGFPCALRGVLFDITEQKTAEEELEVLQKKLLETSRQAGMAEVATGVLHNVGNVLNSVNVSSTLICDQVRNSRITRVHDVARLFEQHAGNLPHFLATDPKGRLLPDYLASLSTHIESERQELLGEVALLLKNVEHIKEIVAMQQNYARVSGIIESLSLPHLIEDAVQMNSAALARHGILVLRDFQEVPVISVDKHKVLQILVNLIRNAKYAIDAAGQPDKRLSLTLRVNDRRMIEITVADSGVGIAPGDLTRVFSHGFTTKKDGHGFGLHSGALAAKEMGGSLTGWSEGLGKGAKFVLQLPCDGGTPASRPQNGATS